MDGTGSFGDVPTVCGVTQLAAAPTDRRYTRTVACVACSDVVPRTRTLDGCDPSPGITY